MLKTFGGSAGRSCRGKKARFDSSCLTPPVYIHACANDSMSRHMFRHLKRYWAVHLCKTLQPPSQLQPNPSMPSFFPPASSCRLPGGEAAIISYARRAAPCGTAATQASARSFCAQKIQLKNNYQKISGSPVRLYCLNRCFLFICCNNTMAFF